MAIITGRVERVFERDTKFGKSFSLKVGETWYGLGKDRNGVSDGDYVEFLADQNDKGYWDIKKGSLKPGGAPEKESKPVAADRTAKLTGSGQTYSNDGRQDSIVYQSSRKDALEFLKLLTEQGCIDTGKLKGADKANVLEAHLDRLTTHFIEEVKSNKPFPVQPPTKASTTNAEQAVNDGPEDQLPF